MIQQNITEGLNVKLEQADVNKNATEIHTCILGFYPSIIFAQRVIGNKLASLKATLISKMQILEIRVQLEIPISILAYLLDEHSMNSLFDNEFSMDKIGWAQVP